ncbi:hypothetical protein B296_00017698 [Ensete ventricosum]|uniref:Uncharacterized protein n=1 Tax=Ensete ventricosum TaxID=4639 RepID=A0A426YEM5_ENSVE|nr:hypothetical protein B296_00017698 [Ensete ventricosum]
MASPQGVAASKRNRPQPRLLPTREVTHGQGCCQQARSPKGMASAYRGGAYGRKQRPQGRRPRRCPLHGRRQPVREAPEGHSAHRSYRLMGSDARSPTRAATPAAKEVAHGQGDR